MLAAACLAGACHRRAPAPPPPSADRPRTVVLRPLTQLLPGRITHVTADAVHNVYFVQETDEGQDVVFVAGPDDVAMPTVLTSAAILAATGPIPSQPAARANDSGPPVKAPAGNIQSLLAMPDGSVVFYFNGSAGGQPRSCVGLFKPRSADLSILAAAPRLANLSNMGAAIGLARGTLFRARPGGADDQAVTPPYLLLRHSDAWALLQLGEPVPSTASMAEGIRLAFDRLTPPADQPPPQSLPQLMRENVNLAATNDGLVAVDLDDAALWQIDLQGVARRAAVLDGFPSAMSLPATAEDGSIVLLAPDGPTLPIRGDNPGGNPSRVVHLHYPAFLRFSADGKLAESVSSDAIRAYAGLPLYMFHPTALTEDVEDKVAARWIAFDMVSGQLVRVYLQ
jgi:hypothetical protein